MVVGGAGLQGEKEEVRSAVNAGEHVGQWCDIIVPDQNSLIIIPAGRKMNIISKKVSITLAFHYSFWGDPYLVYWGREAITS